MIVRHLHLTVFSTCLTAMSLAAAYAGTQPKPLGPYRGYVEISSSSSTPMVGLTVDAVGTSGSRDEFVDVMFIAQLRPGVEKPPPLRGLGQISYLDDQRSIRVFVGNQLLYFIAGGGDLPAAGPEQANYRAGVVDVIISTRRADGVPPRKHAEAVEAFLRLTELPFRRK